MRRLSKRWEPFTLVNLGHTYRTFLSEPATIDNPEPIAWGCIEAEDVLGTMAGPFRLEIWDNQEEEWGYVQTFPTLKQAKEVGRLLAGVALAKNI